MKVTEYGYFGRTTNVKGAPIDAAGVEALVVAIAALPDRAEGAVNVFPFPAREKGEMADRLARIRAEVQAEARETGTRRFIAGSSGTVDKPLPVRRPVSAPIAPVSRARPIAATHEPCSFCAVRGDVGCAHQRPLPKDGE